MRNIFLYIAHSWPNCLKDVTQSCKLCAARYGNYMAKFSVPYHRGWGVWGLGSNTSLSWQYDFKKWIVNYRRFEEIHIYSTSAFISNLNNASYATWILKVFGKISRHLSQKLKQKIPPITGRRYTSSRYWLYKEKGGRKSWYPHFMHYVLQFRINTVIQLYFLK